jgi:hypothetical protein
MAVGVVVVSLDAESPTAVTTSLAGLRLEQATVLEDNPTRQWRSQLRAE